MRDNFHDLANVIVKLHQKKKQHSKDTRIKQHSDITTFLLNTAYQLGKKNHFFTTVNSVSHPFHFHFRGKIRSNEFFFLLLNSKLILEKYILIF